MDDVDERIAAGLRAMRHKPTHLVFLGCLVEWTYDRPTACGLPVIHVPAGMSTRATTEPRECPFLPGWDAECVHGLLESARFVRGYCE